MLTWQVLEQSPGGLQQQQVGSLARGRKRLLESLLTVTVGAGAPLHDPLQLLSQVASYETKTGEAVS